MWFFPVLCLECVIKNKKRKIGSIIEFYCSFLIRGRLDASLCQIESLQVQLSVQRQRLRAEEIFRKQIESDLRKLQDEKRNIMVR